MNYSTPFIIGYKTWCKIIALWLILPCLQNWTLQGHSFVHSITILKKPQVSKAVVYIALSEA